MMKKDPLLMKIVLVSLIFLSMSACAMFSGRETAGQYVDDASITMKIKADILGDANLKVLQVNVETMQGVVQLSGFVDSARSENRAVDIARKTPGVKSVQDSLVIR